MATIQQKQLFVWNDIENLGDLERLKLTILRSLKKSNKIIINI